MAEWTPVGDPDPAGYQWMRHGEADEEWLIPPFCRTDAMADWYCACRIVQEQTQAALDARRGLKPRGQARYRRALEAGSDDVVGS